MSYPPRADRHRAAVNRAELPHEYGDSAAGSLGAVLILVFIFLSYSRAAELFLPTLRIPLITSVLALVLVAFTGGLQRAFSSRAGLWLAAFTMWLFITVPFSSWPGGSFRLLTEQWLKSFMLFVIVAGALRTPRHCKLAMYAIGAAVLFIVALTFIFGTNELGGRLALEEGVLANPNDLAQVILVGTPGLLLFGMAPSSSAFRRAITGLCLLATLFVTLQTGSRGAIVVLVGLLLVLLWSLQWGTKLKVFGGALLVVLVVLPFLSDEQWYRYSTILSGAPAGSDEALGSRESRIDLLEQSVHLTFEHPLFGVGPGVFDVASAEYSKQRSERAIWHNPHNSYTQVSSESGLPGFVCYIAALLTCIKTTSRLYKRGRKDANPELSNISFVIWLSLTIFSISIFFSSVAYHPYLPMLAGLSVAVEYAALQGLSTIPVRRRGSMAQSPLLVAGTATPNRGGGLRTRIN